MVTVFLVTLSAQILLYLFFAALYRFHELLMNNFCSCHLMENIMSDISIIESDSVGYLFSDPPHTPLLNLFISLSR